MSDDRPIVIKKVKKVVGGGHHGGAWKVAYADFVTAMMAFFLLLWLVSQVPAEKLSGIADYFTPTAGIKGKVGDTGKGGQGSGDIGRLKDGGATPSVIFGAPDTVGPVSKAPESVKDSDADFDGSDFNEEQAFDTSVKNRGELELSSQSSGAITISENSAELIEAALEQKRFEQIEDEIREQIEGNPDLAAFAENLKIDQTDQGLRIQITDLEDSSMFERGSSRLSIETEPLLAKISEVIQGVQNKVAISGHTDGYSFGSGNEYGNWELSADRANTSRRFLIEAGLEPKRIFKVEGKADQDNFIKNDPFSPENRRIGIILMKQSLAPFDK